MGIDSWDHTASRASERSQANYAKALWAQIERHCSFVSGGDIAFYSDEWSKYQPREDLAHCDDGAARWYGRDPDEYYVRCDDPSLFDDDTPWCEQTPGGWPGGGGPDDCIDEEHLGRDEDRGRKSDR